MKGLTLVFVAIGGAIAAAFAIQRLAPGIFSTGGGSTGGFGRVVKGPRIHDPRVVDPPPPDPKE